MQLKTTLFVPIAGMFLLLGNACRPGQPSTPAGELYARFQHLAPADTLAVRLDTITEVSGTEVGASLFIAAIDSVLQSKMLYPADTFDFQAQAYWRVALDENYDACLIDIRQVWFQFKYLLVYSKQAGEFVDLAPAAWFYGGDGGQVLSESRIFDLETAPTILIRELEHSLRWSEADADEPEDINIQGVRMKRFLDGEFQEIPVQDTGEWIRRYPLSIGQ